MNSMEKGEFNGKGGKGGKGGNPLAFLNLEAS
jgi:hypothetical protein